MTDLILGTATVVAVVLWATGNAAAGWSVVAAAFVVAVVLGVVSGKN